MSNRGRYEDGIRFLLVQHRKALFSAINRRKASRKKNDTPNLYLESLEEAADKIASECLSHAIKSVTVADKYAGCRDNITVRAVIPETALSMTIVEEDAISEELEYSGYIARRFSAQPWRAHGKEVNSRKPGFYWVQSELNAWHPAKYISDFNCWLVAGFEGFIEPSSIKKVGPRILPPEGQEDE